MNLSKIVAIALAIALICGAHSADAAFWNLATGSSWNTAANWNPVGVPNGSGVNATFNGAATVNNPAQTANRTITLDGVQTVGSIVFNTDLSTFTNSLTTGTGGALTLDEAGAGPATITTMGAGTGNNTISAPMTLTDSLSAVVNNTAATSAAGSLNLTATIAGAGGVTKSGDGLMTFGTGAKTYTGATVVNGGRFRTSSAASPTATSSLTINAGGQMTQITAATYTFGAGPLNLNGSGPTTGPFAAFPGAIRPDTGLAITITNSVVLQSDSLIHAQGSGTGILTLSGGVSGAGKLLLGSIPHDANLGQLILSGSNSFAGGAKVQAGTLVAAAASTNAFGTGNVTVDIGNATFAGSFARLQIVAGAVNAINDFATLLLAGGGTAGVADDGNADLGAGINDLISGLILGGFTQVAPGTYGSSASGATFQNDEYFSGTGVVTLIPEPASLTLLGIAVATLLLRYRRA